jgi:hypothetical protein
MENLPNLLVLDLTYLREVFEHEIPDSSGLLHVFTMSEAIEVAIEFKDNIGDFFTSNGDEEGDSERYDDQAEVVWMMADRLSAHICSIVGHGYAWYMYSFLEWIDDSTAVVIRNDVDLPESITKRLCSNE